VAKQFHSSQRVLSANWTELTWSLILLISGIAVI